MDLSLSVFAYEWAGRETVPGGQASVCGLSGPAPPEGFTWREVRQGGYLQPRYKDVGAREGRGGPDLPAWKEEGWLRCQKRAWQGPGLGGHSRGAPLPPSLCGPVSGWETGATLGLSAETGESRLGGDRGDGGEVAPAESCQPGAPVLSRLARN